MICFFWIGSGIENVKLNSFQDALGYANKVKEKTYLHFYNVIIFISVIGLTNYFKLMLILSSRKVI